MISLYCDEEFTRDDSYDSRSSAYEFLQVVKNVMTRLPQIEQGELATWIAKCVAIVKA
ncbi:hypothetical protein TRIATDRAFT_300043 [Trichoderma atroviride IMI 206040]|uniref:Uncharacterized protein n=1 Tax=Hypocrea atroviridis (strain ATCC 20476 / IMI 206040) TaxID=452589 RepID=G9NWP8_HYPAI|nr:uncharacterized protein TRIATDRAFT_300043 [Trichoderma atroviride IMI 206040]EHK45399.1 hypothetical protein TRIATDRAFT_300043 [Trichoderma atroviride IMI 206040]